MKITTAENGKKVIELESWEEVGLKIVVPRMAPRTSSDELISALQKIPIDIALKSDEIEIEALGLNVLAKIVVTPIYCPHGKPDSISIKVESDETPVDFSFLVYPTDESFECDQEITGDEGE